MCGIAGTVNWGNVDTVARMADIQAHRGPDDRGFCFFAEERVGLGHRRLSVIDLSPAGHQPMGSEDGLFWIVFNGEIYNFAELRRSLEHRGYRFKSRTDTEVILHLYEEEGVECVRRLNGMFAFAILDRRKQKLILVRDHLGIKPLYYYRHNGHFVFGSEIKAILSSGIYSMDLNWQGLYDYFTYLYVPCPETMFRGIFQVPPAHVLVLDLRCQDIQIQRYWQLDEANSLVDTATSSYEEAKEMLRWLLADSVQRQGVSDVPLGIFLSGGVDSPILAGLMAEKTSTPVRTFTVIFRGKDFEFYDESALAREVAKKFGTVHHEIPVEIADPQEMLKLVEFFDQPFGNPTFYLMYLISKHTRSEVTVALCGTGGDELFAGYPRYRAMVFARWLRRLPRPLLGGVRRLLDVAPDGYRTRTLHRIRKLLSGLDEDFARQFVKWTYFLDEKQKQSLFHQRAWEKTSGNGSFLPSDRIIRRRLDESPLEDFGNRVLHLDLQTFLPDNLLEYTDKMSMAVGLEVRVPYLDRRIVEHSLTVPFHDKVSGRRSKIILKDAFADLLPRANCRTAKKGFNVPLALWMRDYLGRYFDRFMSREEVERFGILNWEYIQRLRHQHRTGRWDHSDALFSIIMFDIWYRRYMLGWELSQTLDSW